ncbi:DUF3078 domain-containing protein [Pseudopedobacter beijingensis]|uniref:DUF3078 domain-containing protein n=1 Tax=Pseudopedobacter beijingensis TaxID=1207056 RepID=A0ABW4IIR3_9SPHI
MRKTIITSVFMLGSLLAVAQNKDEVKEGWSKKGNISLLFNQSAFNNWIAGGENNVSGTLGLNYDFNYKRGQNTWDNKIIGAYGLVRTKNSEFAKKTDDRLELNSLYGRQASGNWYYSGVLNFKTQFAEGYNYGTDNNGKEIRTSYTNFFSPAYLTFGPGMLWKKSDNLKVNLAPATSRMVFVDKNRTLPNAKYFGVEEGKGMRYELGFYTSAYYKLNLMENVSMENILSLYADYLDKPQNVDIDYQLNLVMKINKYLSTNLAFQTVYDDNAFAGFQIRQVFGVGVNVGF